MLCTRFKGTHLIRLSQQQKIHFITKDQRAKSQTEMKQKEAFISKSSKLFPNLFCSVGSKVSYFELKDHRDEYNNKTAANKTGE